MTVWKRATTTTTSLDAEQDKGAKKPWEILLIRLGIKEYLKFLMIHWLQELTYLRVKRRVKKLERRKRSRTHWLKRLYKVGLSTRVKSSKDEGLGEEYASKHGRIADDEGIVKSVDVAEQAKEVVDDITLAKVLIDIKITKPKADKIVIQELEKGTSTTTPTTITAASSRPKAKGLVIHEQEQAPTSIVSS
nr:hypothetical protein [Tanacetum cinerariifolium]